MAYDWWFVLYDAIFIANIKSFLKWHSSIRYIFYFRRKTIDLVSLMIICVYLWPPDARPAVMEQFCQLIHVHTSLKLYLLPQWHQGTESSRLTASVSKQIDALQTDNYFWKYYKIDLTDIWNKIHNIKHKIWFLVSKC